MIRRVVPRDFLWSAPVWQADLDAFGEVRSVQLLRLMQEAATRASSDAGFDARYYERTGTMWLIRRTTLSLASPARYGDVLTVRTWISDFRRVRSQREYTVHADDRLVALASSDWVFVERSTGRLRRIPPEWQTVFTPEGTPRVPFPETNPPFGVMAQQRRVELHELDALRHVNNANYVAYLEQAALDAVSARGWGLDVQIAAGGRLRAVRHDLEYLDSALYGDSIAITTWATAVTPTDVEYHVHLHRGDARRPLLQARSHYAWTSDAGASALPPALRDALAAT
jgi:acyl-CoA thioester hydrolase